MVILNEFSYDLSEIKSYVGYVETAQYMFKVLGL